MSDGSVRNAYTLRLRNMQSRPRSMTVTIEGLPGAVMWTDSMDRAEANARQDFTVPADQLLSVRAYVVAPPESATGEIRFVLSANDSGNYSESDSADALFTGPGDGR